MDNNRLVLHTVHTDDGATELYFGRASDDMQVGWEGSFLFHHQGDDQGVTYKFWADAGDEDAPMVLHVEGRRVRVTLTEDQPPAYDEDEVVLFDSDKFRYPDPSRRVAGEIEDPTRELVFAIGAADVSDPANLRWLARCAEARAAELES